MDKRHRQRSFTVVESKVHETMWGSFERDVDQFLDEGYVLQGSVVYTEGRLVAFLVKEWWEDNSEQV